MVQQDDETVNKFIAKIWKQAKNCNFTDPDTDISLEEKTTGRRRSHIKEGARGSLSKLRKWEHMAVL